LSDARHYEKSIPTCNDCGSVAMCVCDREKGISRRDWLAGMAMQGMVANPTNNRLDDERIARETYRMADAMIAEADRKEPEK